MMFLIDLIFILSGILLRTWMMSDSDDELQFRRDNFFTKHLMYEHTRV